MPRDGKKVQPELILDGGPLRVDTRNLAEVRGCRHQHITKACDVTVTERPHLAPGILWATYEHKGRDLRYGGITQSVLPYVFDHLNNLPGKWDKRACFDAYMRLFLFAQTGPQPQPQPEPEPDLPNMPPDPPEEDEDVEDDPEPEPPPEPGPEVDPAQEDLDLKGGRRELVFEHRGHAVTDSLKVSESFGKDHKNVLRDIDDLMKRLPEFGRLNFEPTSYRDTQGKTQRLIRMTKDGFSFLALGFTGDKADRFKLKYIDAFNTMEEALRAGFRVPKTLPEALRAYAGEVESHEQTRGLLAAETRRADKNQKYADLLQAILESDEEWGLHQFAVEVANMGEITFTRELHARGYLKLGSNGKSYARREFIVAGIFRHAHTWHLVDGRLRKFVSAVKITGKGFVHFLKEFNLRVPGWPTTFDFDPDPKKKH